MAIEYGWYGTRGTGGTTKSDMDAWANTGMTVYISYGLWNQSWSNWKIDADAVIVLLKSSTATDVDLILEISEHAWGNTARLEDINTWYDGESRVVGYYVDEPNLPTRNITITDQMVLQAKCILDKPLYVVIRPDGGRDPADPDKTPVENADQSTYNGYAADCDKIGAFWYPLGNSSSPEWADIEEIQAQSGQSAGLHYATNTNPSKPAFFAVQSAPIDNQREPKQGVQNVPDTGYDGKRFSAEWFWMVHNATYYGCKTVLFYHNSTASDNLVDAINDTCEYIIESESTFRALDTVPLASSADPDTSEVEWILPSSSAPDILWSYHYFSGSYWLLVIDKNAESSSGKPRQHEFKVNLHDRHDNFQLLRNAYNIWQTQGRGLSLYTENPGGTWKQYDSGSTFSDRMLGQGQVFMYRFKCDG